MWIISDGDWGGPEQGVQLLAQAIAGDDYQDCTEIDLGLSAADGHAGTRIDFSIYYGDDDRRNYTATIRTPIEYSPADIITMLTGTVYLIPANPQKSP